MSDGRRGVSDAETVLKTWSGLVGYGILGRLMPKTYAFLDTKASSLWSGWSRELVVKPRDHPAEDEHCNKSPNQSDDAPEKGK